MTRYEKIKSMSLDDIAEIIEKSFIIHRTECPQPRETDCVDCKYYPLCTMPMGEAKQWLEMEIKE